MLAHGLCSSSSWVWRQVQNPRDSDNGLPEVQSAGEVGAMERSHSQA